MVSITQTVRYTCDICAKPCEKPVLCIRLPYYDDGRDTQLAINLTPHIDVAAGQGHICKKCLCEYLLQWIKEREG